MNKAFSGVEKNKNYVIEITGMTHEGQGVGRINGLAVFVDGALTGEEIEVKIIKLNKSYAVGKIIEIKRPSPNRIRPFCGAYSRCGGCNLQHMDYAAQLKLKAELVRDNLERIGGLKGVRVHDTIGMEAPYTYRNKAQYPVAEVDGKIVTGFYAPRSHVVIDSEECGIQDTASDKIRKAVRQFAAEKGIAAYDETTGKGLLRHIMTRAGFRTGEMMVVLVINGRKLPDADELVKRLVAMELGQGKDMGCAADGYAQNERAGNEFISSGVSSAPAIKSIYLNINTNNTNIILGNDNILLYGSETITDTIGEYRFNISPHSFFQVNPIQTEVLYAKALEYAGLTGDETVFDLYCGIGTISLFLSSKARKVYGVEVVEQAIADAKKNAEQNVVDNVEFICGESERIVPELYKQGIKADVVVVDPPRKGCDESLLQLLSEMQPERIVYVSCNPSTLARDLKFMSTNGYSVEEAQPVDMFPWSGHVECVVLMTNSGSKG